MDIWVDICTVQYYVYTNVLYVLIIAVKSKYVIFLYLLGLVQNLVIEKTVKVRIPAVIIGPDTSVRGIESFIS